MMAGYVLIDDIFEEMSQNITYIKLNSYLVRERERKS